MIFRQAVEKLPEEGKTVPVKINGEYDLGWYSFLDGFQTLNHGKKDIQLVEWLDESSDDHVYAIYGGCIFEGGGVGEIYRSEEKAIKFALMQVEEKNKHAYEIHGKDPDWKERFYYKEQTYDFPTPHIVKVWATNTSEIIVYKYELL